MSEQPVPHSSRQLERSEPGDNPLPEAGADADRSRDVVEPQRQQQLPPQQQQKQLQLPPQQHASASNILQSSSKSVTQRGSHQADAAPTTSALQGQGRSDAATRRARLTRQNAVDEGSPPGRTPEAQTRVEESSHHDSAAAAGAPQRQSLSGATAAPTPATVTKELTNLTLDDQTTTTESDV